MYIKFGWDWINVLIQLVRFIGIVVLNSMSLSEKNALRFRYIENPRNLSVKDLIFT